MNNKIITIVLKAIAVAMAVAVIVLSILGNLSADSAFMMLAIGLGCLAVASLQKA